MIHEEQIEQAENFFSLLFGNVHETAFSYLLTIDGSDNKKTLGSPQSFDISTAENRRAMAEMAIALSDAGHNVYFGVNCSSVPPTKYSRGDSSKITLQTATICDIDIEGGNHKNGKKKKLAKDFADAKSFLPFELTLLNHSGGGLHGYAIFAEPIRINDENRTDVIRRNKKFIDVIRSKAGKDIQIDGVGDLCRVLRVAGTRNYKGGVLDDAPICHVVETADVRFTPDNLDIRLDSVILSNEKKNLQPVVKKLRDKQKKSSPTRFDSVFDADEYNIFRAERMLDVLKTVNHEDLSYGRWLAINTACKNIGVDYAIVDAFNQCEPTNYNAEQNARRWQMLNDTSFDIQTLHGIAKDFGYSEKDARIAFRRLYPEKFNKGGSAEKLFSDDDYQKYFGGDCSDLDNAIRLENFCGSDVCWLKDDEQWLLYQNGRWQRGSDKPSCLLSLAQKLYAVLSQNAIDADAVKIADCFKQTGKTFAAISFLRGRDSILITGKDLDNHLNLLNCLNGVIDLQTGNFYSHVAKRDALITQQCNAAYYPDATSELVDKFFRDIMPDEETRRGLLRWLGYNITGENCEEKFLLWFGRGSNGKGVLGASLIELLGDYACTLNQRALLRNSTFSDDANKASTSLNCLEKKRFALSEELPQKAELNVELLKNLTGGDRLAIRQLYREERTIRNYAKLNLSGNFLPTIENVDDLGLKRRLLQMPFTVQFGGSNGKPIDYDLKRKMLLPENLSALLFLLIREAVAWYRRDDGGLIISDIMKQATERHLDENNFVAEFIDTGEKFVRVKGATVKAKDFIAELSKAYPAECAKFKKQDLIHYISNVGGVEYGVDKLRFRVFKGICKLAGSDFDGESVTLDDTPTPFNENDLSL